MIFDSHYALSDILLGLGALISIAVQWGLLKRTMKEFEERVEEMEDDIEDGRKIMSDVRLELNKEFATRALVTEVETRLLERYMDINKQVNTAIMILTDEVREIRKYMMEKR